MKRTTEQKINDLLKEDRESRQVQSSIVTLVEPRISELLPLLTAELEVAKKEFNESVAAYFTKEGKRDESDLTWPSFGPVWQNSRAQGIEELIALFEAGGEVSLVASDARVLSTVINPPTEEAPGRGVFGQSGT